MGRFFLAFAFLRIFSWRFGGSFCFDVIALAAMAPVG